MKYKENAITWIFSSCKLILRYHTSILICLPDCRCLRFLCYHYFCCRCLHCHCFCFHFLCCRVLCCCCCFRCCRLCCLVWCWELVATSSTFSFNQPKTSSTFSKSGSKPVLVLRVFGHPVTRPLLAQPAQNLFCAGSYCQGGF